MLSGLTLTTTWIRLAVSTAQFFLCSLSLESADEAVVRIEEACDSDDMDDDRDRRINPGTGDGPFIGERRPPRLS